MKTVEDVPPASGEKAVLVGLVLGRRSQDAAHTHLEELAELSRSSGLHPIRSFLQEREAIDPAYYIGRGKVEEIAACIQAEEADVAIFDDELAPNQQRNLEDKLRCRVLDRTLLVLDIFARRAKTREGKLQVELAQLSYLLPRLGGRGIQLSRLGGGIGTRGPGETQLETDRRRIRKRISLLRRDLADVSKRRAIHRDRRQKIPAPTVALVGYTNAGKSTLFNAVAHAATPSSSQLFATLDPLLRSFLLPDRRLVLISDTVGFIRKLPHQLVAAFRATLEEVTHADLLLHVIDASAEGYKEQEKAVGEVLDTLGCSQTPTIRVFNKVDLLDLASWERLNRISQSHFENPVLVSAKTGAGLEHLKERIGKLLPDRRIGMTLKIPYGEQRLRSALHASSLVLKEEFLGEDVVIEVLVDPVLAVSLEKYRTTGCGESRFSAVNRHGPKASIG